MATLAALALAAVLAQPVEGPAPEVGADTGAGAETAPPGSPDDRRLWGELRAATNGATVGMGRIAQCSFRVRYGKYYERLGATLKDGTDAEKAEAGALRERLAAEATAADEAVPEQPGVRACQYVLRDLGVFMPVASDARATKQLPALREKAWGCVAKLVPLAERLRERASALEAALAAVDARAARPAATAAGAAPRRAPAAAETAPPGNAEGSRQ